MKTKFAYYKIINGKEITIYENEEEFKDAVYDLVTSNQMIVLFSHKSFDVDREGWVIECV